MVNLIDTHCHLDFDRYDGDRDAVIQRAHEVGVTRIIIPATHIDGIQGCLDFATQYDGVYAAVGVHPNSTAAFESEWIHQIEAASQNDKVVAIGEIGLDYYWDKSPVETQKRAFKAQLGLAAKLELPVIIHNREASDDVMEILEEWVSDLPTTIKGRPGVLHSFSAPQEIAERAIAAGFYLGFTGPVTFKNAADLRSVVAMIPQDRILVETDGPFLAPVPYRGKRNEPAYIPHIIDRLAGVRKIAADEMAKRSTENAIRLFNL